MELPNPKNLPIIILPRYNKCRDKLFKHTHNISTFYTPTLAWLFLDLALSAWNPKCRKANDALLRNPFAKISFCTQVICKKLIFTRILQPHMFKMLQVPHFLTFFHKIFSGVSTNLVRCYTEKFMKFHTKIKCTELFVWTCSLHFSFFFHFGGLYWKKNYYNFFF